MNCFQPKFILICLISLLSYTLAAQTQSRTGWFEDARFGMFIHWGLYSGAEGLWKGEKLRYLNNYAEWIRYRNRISKEEYGTLAKRFDWEQINPEEWVLLAKKSGMKYIIMTAKHHDGVAIWDTKIGDYSLPKLSGTKRDVIKEIADACRKHNMKLGFYYSHWIDWAHPYAWDHNQELTGHVTDAQFNTYWQEKALPQLQELLTQYGDIAVMWFDMWIPYQQTIFKKEQLEQAVSLIRRLQPQCLINSRLGLPTDAEYVDFETLGDNQFGSNYVQHPWETPGTIAHSWGYNGQEQEWKSTGQLFTSLVGNVALNGGFTLNIGPRANGKVPYESISRLNDLGTWLTKYGESIYGTTGVSLRPNQHDWGKITVNKESNAVYLHVFNWPLDRVLRVSGFTEKPESVALLTADGVTKLRYEQTGPIMHINLPMNAPDHFDAVIRVTFKNIAIDSEVVAESTFGGFALNAMNAKNNQTLHIVKYDGTRPSFVKSNEETDIQWDIFFPKAGLYNVDLSAHNPSDSSSTVAIEIGDKTVSGEIPPSGKIVVEPNENNYTDEFVNHQLGQVNITQPGRYTIRLKVKGEPIIWIHNIWLSNK
ncbi:alpha-L-fucosidase [Sphingobacterium psychroaquaticum]|uniref:alpha-L-fucosidase n=1 Tax=Sphingobacterium psychroaquaticum TaxID=561061 RepID=UPI00106AC5CF|nr:alpha-L-fucosidase [Sphingobacterium psychroaquaticum]QBQ42477.1 alpha-L-fucosidase [Sphingobacterium psychroaquaticum]